RFQELTYAYVYPCVPSCRRGVDFGLQHVAARAVLPVAAGPGCPALAGGAGGFPDRNCVGFRAHAGRPAADHAARTRHRQLADSVVFTPLERAIARRDPVGPVGCADARSGRAERAGPAALAGHAGVAGTGGRTAL